MSQSIELTIERVNRTVIDDINDHGTIVASNQEKNDNIVECE